MILVATLIHATTTFDFDPELSYGVQDNSDAWIEIVPARLIWNATPTTRFNGAISYQFEIPRYSKPLNYINHHGFRINAQVETRLTPDVWAFVDVNIGQKVDGALCDIDYLRNFNYQRVGIKIHIWN